MVELRHVRCLQLALQPALLRHSVMQPMFASMVINNLTDKMIFYQLFSPQLSVQHHLTALPW